MSFSCKQENVLPKPVFLQATYIGCQAILKCNLWLFWSQAFCLLA